jgi:cobalt-zinc-cadmium efflux system protein
MEKCLFGLHSHAPVKEDHHHDHHDHDHDHSHDYRHMDKKVLLISLLITFGAMLLEIVYGFLAGSLALLSDAIHMFTHSFALGISYFAIVMSGRKSPADKTFGYHRMEVLAAFVNAVTIGLSVIWIIYEAVARFINPQPLEAGVTLAVAVFGLLVNIATGVILVRGDMSNVNLRSAFMHMMADTVSSVAIILGFIVIYFTGWVIIDTLLALMVAAVIAKWSYGLFKDSVNVLLESSPVDIDELKRYISGYDAVVDVHDIHVWEVTHRMYCMSAHIMLKGSEVQEYHRLVKDISHELMHRFKIGHVTLQPEWE